MAFEPAGDNPINTLLIRIGLDDRNDPIDCSLLSGLLK